MSANTGKILPLESLRGLAALSVVIYHDGATSALYGNAFFQNAFVMVDFFFVLSGFVIALNYFDRIDSAGDLYRFQKKRFWRLYPLHLVTLLAFLGIETAKFVFERKTGIAANTPAFTGNDISAFLANLGLAHSFLVPQPSFNIPSWSISAEFYTYLVFGLVMLLPRRAVLVPAIGLIAIAFFAVFNGGSLAEGFLYSLPRCIASFFIGASVHLLMQRVSFSFPSYAQPLALAAAVLAVIAWARTPFEVVLPFLFAAVVLVFAAGEHRTTARFLSVRPLVYLGTISYSVYMTHSMVWWACKQIARFGFGMETVADADGDIQILVSPQMEMVFTTLQIAITIAVSHLTYTFVEKRFRYGLPKRLVVGGGNAVGDKSEATTG